MASAQGLRGASPTLGEHTTTHVVIVCYNFAKVCGCKVTYLWGNPMLFLIYVFFLTLALFCLFFDGVYHITDAVACCPRWANQGRQEPNEVGNALLSLDDRLLVLVYF